MDGLAVWGKPFPSDKGRQIRRITGLKSLSKLSQIYLKTLSYQSHFTLNLIRLPS